MIGARGRVDMIGPKGIVRLVIVPKDSSGPKIRVNIRKQDEPASKKDDVKSILDWDWKISTPPPNIRYFDLNKESFQDALMDILNG